MTRDNFLIDAGDGTQRFRALELLATGRSHQIVRVEEAASDGARSLCARAALYDAERTDDADYMQGRREAMEAERRFLQEVESPLLPEPVAFFRATLDATLGTTTDEAGFEGEPVLVCEWREGLTIFEWIRREHPEGCDPTKALEMLGELVEFLTAVHKAGYVYRDLDPRHFIVDADGALVGAVGFGNATPRAERPNPHKFAYDASPYVAPEIRGDRSGTMLRPAADSYAVGALMSFILTGEEPRTVVENPLGHLAYERLSNLDPPGLALLVARLIQPHAKNRVGRMERLAKYTTPDGLPTMHTKGFGMLLLPAPFSGVEDPKNNRALKSKLSAGPLISVAPEAPNTVAGTMLESGISEEDQQLGENIDDSGMPTSWAIAASLLGLVQWRF
jgi:serine/threonine protein kinase